MSETKVTLTFAEQDSLTFATVAEAVEWATAVQRITLTDVIFQEVAV